MAQQTKEPSVTLETHMVGEENWPRQVVLGPIHRGCNVYTHTDA